MGGGRGGISSEGWGFLGIPEATPAVGAAHPGLAQSQQQAPPGHATAGLLGGGGIHCGVGTQQTHPGGPPAIQVEPASKSPLVCDFALNSWAWVCKTQVFCSRTRGRGVEGQTTHPLPPGSIHLVENAMHVGKIQFGIGLGDRCSWQELKPHHCLPTPPGGDWGIISTVKKKSHSLLKKTSHPLPTLPPPPVGGVGLFGHSTKNSQKPKIKEKSKESKDGQK